MVRHLRRKQFKSFIAQLSVYSGLEPDLVHDILKQQYGRGLAIICVALDITKADYMNLYLLTQPLRGSSRIIKDSSISKAMDSFDHTDRKQARLIVKNGFRTGE